MKAVAKVLLYDKVGHALILWRSKTHPVFPHVVDLPGGEIDEGETAIIAAKRELDEEAGIDIELEQLSLLHSRTTKHGRKDYIFGATLSATKPEVTISWEHEAYEWVPPERVPKLMEIEDDYMIVVREHLESVSAP